MWGRIINLVIKDLQQFLRDKVLLSFVLIGPTLLLVMLAYGTGSDTGHLPMGILDEDRTSTSRELIVALDNLEELDATHYLDHVGEVAALLDSGRITVAVVIPSGFATALSSPLERASVQVLVDGSNIVAAYSAVSAAEGTIGQFGQDIAVQREELPAGGNPTGPRLDLRATTRFNQEMNHRYYLLPAQLSVIVHIVTLMVASVGIVRERETGTLEQLMVTPVRRIELIVGKATLPTLVAIVDYLAMLALVVWIFGVPIRGSLPLLLAVTLLFILAQLTWGLVISAASATQQQAFLLIFMIGILNVGFSGYLVAVENMPLLMQWASSFFPIRHYLFAMRSIMIKGATLSDIAPQVIALVALGIASLIVSVRSFRKQLE
jgi:ABC-2 type transport system permease protein